MFGDTIRFLRQQKGYTQAYVADVLHLSRVTYNRYENNEREPDFATLQEIANFYCISLDELITGKKQTPLSVAKRKGVKIPVLGRVVAGIPLEAITEVLDYEEISESMAATGDFFAANCEQRGITPYLTKLPMQSGIAYTFISPGGERTFATYLGAAAMMGPETLASEMFDGYDYLYVEGYLVQNHALILRAVELAKEKGLKVCLDLASYNIVAADHEFFTRLVTEYVDVVFANEEEARAFAEAEPAEALERLHSLCEVAVVKLGPAGATIMSRGEKVFVEAWPVEKVTDTTAAGDFYAAGVMYGLMNGCSLTQCAQVGTILSGHVIQIVGTQLSEEVWAQMKSLIAQTLAS